MAKHRITLLPGDGIGPEVTASVVAIIECAGVEVEWEKFSVGAEALSIFGDPLPQDVLDSILKNKVALKGPVTTPVGTGFASINVRLRKTLDLYANLRPVLSMPNIKTRFENVDLVVVRENTEDLYSGLEHEVVPGVVESLKIITEKASTRIARFAFASARLHGRKRVTAVHKANIMKLSDGLFLQCFRNVSKDYPEIVADDRIVDNLCMQLVTDPTRYDVLLLENLYGDIVSDLAAGPGRRTGRGGRRQHRRERRGIRSRARQRARHRRAEQGQPPGPPQVRSADAAAPRRDGCREEDQRRHRQSPRLRSRTSDSRHRRDRHDLRLHRRHVRHAAPRDESRRLIAGLPRGQVES
jgi:Isocitrate/isopropylmalate dehydrogenase